MEVKELKVNMEKTNAMVTRKKMKKVSSVVNYYTLQLPEKASGRNSIFCVERKKQCHNKC